MNGLPGSRILITTRKETVARMMESTHVISMKEMSEQECRSLFKRLAFFDRSPSECENLDEIGKEIVRKCKGLPLAAKTIGSLLRFKKTRQYWQSIVDSELWKLEEFEKGLLAPLLLSYNDLPYKIKRCFTYCAVFPKDWYIEKDELVQLWIAQGYIRPEEIKEMELIGGEYFDCLATRSFFQEFRYDYYGNITNCKMHDIIHDFAQFLIKDECFSKEVRGHDESLTNINREKLRHSMLMLHSNDSFPVSILNAKKLRSLLINMPYDIDLPIFNVGGLTSLRALTICTEQRWTIAQKFVEIPKGIENLIHLRYLKLYRVKMEELPETCCELFNLETLDLEYCTGLRRLPQGIGKLVNLRNLIFKAGSLDYIPKGFERLTNLRSLLGEIVRLNVGKYSKEAFSLEGLRHLNHLRGDLSIQGLGNEKFVDEAKNAELGIKTKIVGLSLYFIKDEEEAAAANHQGIMEALKPPPNLEHLLISDYAGKFPLSNWILSLTKLKSLRICRNKWEIIPPLGTLPSLEKLKIDSLGSVKRVGDEFLGIHSADGSGSSSSASVVTAFPKLEHLTFYDMDAWDEWDDFGITRSRKEDITILPQLKWLEMTVCRKLKSLPDQLLQNTTLTTLKITQCDILKERFEKDTGEDWSKICHIEDIRIG